MRIVYLNPISQIGGAERSLLAWLKAVRIDFAKAELFLVLPAPGPLAEAAAALGVRVELVRMPNVVASLGDSAFNKKSSGVIVGTAARVWTMVRLMGAAPIALSYVIRLKRLLRRLHPDLIHSNGVKTHLLSRVVALAGTPIVWHLHDFLGQRAVSRLLRWASKPVAKAVAVSEAVARDARFVLPEVPIEVVYNVTDVDHFCPGTIPGTFLDTLAQLPPVAFQQGEPIRVALVATFARWKGQDVFLDAAALVLQRELGKTVRFYIVGGQVYRTKGSQFSESELRARTERLGIEASVGFISFQPDPLSIYRAADVIVHASTLPEPFGMTIVEGMACGRAVIVSQAGGAAELFTDGGDALGVPAADPARLADALCLLIDDTELRRQLAGNARLSVQKRFNPCDLPRKIHQIYGPVLRK